MAHLQNSRGLAHAPPEIFEFSLNSVRETGSIDIADFTIIGSTLVKSSNLIKHGKRLENMSWRIMGKNLVTAANGPDSTIANNTSPSSGNQQRRGLDPTLVFNNSINPESSVPSLPRTPSKSSLLRKKKYHEKALTLSDFSSIVSIVTQPSLQDVFHGQCHSKKVPTSSNTNTSISLNSQLSSGSYGKSSKIMNRPNLIKRNSSSKGKLTLSYKNNNFSIINNSHNASIYSSKKNKNSSEHLIGTPASFSKKKVLSNNTEKQQPDKIQLKKFQLSARDNVNESVDSSNNQQYQSSSNKVEANNNDCLSSRSSSRDSKGPVLVARNNIRAINPRDEINIGSKKKSGAIFYLKPENESEQSLSSSNLSSRKKKSPSKLQTVPSLFSGSKLRDKPSSGSINSEDKVHEDSHSHSSDSDSDFDIYSDDEHPITKFESNDSFTEKLRELKNQVGLPDEVIVSKHNNAKSSAGRLFGKSDSHITSMLNTKDNHNTNLPLTNKNKSNGDRSFKSLSKKTSKGLINSSDTQSIDSTKRLLKRQSSLFPSKNNNNTTPIIFSDDSFSDDEDDSFSSTSDDEDDENDENDFSNDNSEGKAHFKNAKKTGINGSAKYGRTKGGRSRSITDDDLVDYSDEDDIEDDNAWTDDDDGTNGSGSQRSEGDDITSILFTKKGQDESYKEPQTIKRSLLSGLFLNDLNNHQQQKDITATAVNGVNDLKDLAKRTTSNTSMKRNSTSGSKNENKNKNKNNDNNNNTNSDLVGSLINGSKVLYSDTGGLHLDFNDSIHHHITSEKAECNNGGQNQQQLQSRKYSFSRPPMARKKSDVTNLRDLKSQASSTSLSVHTMTQPIIVNSPTVSTLTATDVKGLDGASDSETTASITAYPSEKTLVRSYSNASADIINPQALLRSNSKSSQTSFTNLFGMVQQFPLFRSSNNENEHETDEAKVARLKSDILRQRTYSSGSANHHLQHPSHTLETLSNAPKAAKSLLNTAYASHMFHQQLPPATAVGGASQRLDNKVMRNSNLGSQARQQSQQFHPPPTNQNREKVSTPKPPQMNDTSRNGSNDNALVAPDDTQNCLAVKEADIRSIVFGKYHKVKVANNNQSRDDTKNEVDNDDEINNFEIDNYHNRGW
ncbi:hypothetical protein DASC09_046840 [Saccharomycopsis crataegensis]|uniref:CHASE domain-containing protein n=1 Tax=Saccharomycopsis crataegensis TaxID=43959 RepID=A0AAV5QRI3_9ASCO|nr:hypothetical protein DASC09_046840 [Saccharomycopsis crataegensis]